MRRSHKSPQTGDNCTVVGWGLTENVRRICTYSNTYIPLIPKKKICGNSTKYSSECKENFVEFCM